MRDCCAANQFDGACEDGKCKSYTARAAEITQAERTVMAKQTAFPFLAVFTFGFSISVAVFGALTLDDHFKREALINQENVHVVQR
ncbi:hypothetical protein GGE31_000085 [Rhizobium cellulosilyticum]|nr:hypothetical protein [Rhizobium cellulosilyticum]MBB4409614.1 hypothetical protein [Rhizobium cellulosilyticum]